MSDGFKKILETISSFWESLHSWLPRIELHYHKRDHFPPKPIGSLPLSDQNRGGCEETRDVDQVVHRQPTEAGPWTEDVVTYHRGVGGFGRYGRYDNPAWVRVERQLADLDLAEEALARHMTAPDQSPTLQNHVCNARAVHT